MRPIQEGDIVNVFWCDKEKSEVIKTKVLHVPCDSGDMWYFKNKNGIVFAQNPSASTFNKEEIKAKETK